MNISVLNNRFSTQQRCISHLEKLRWGKRKFVCPHCGSLNSTKRDNSIKHHCNGCNKDYSVLFGTIFENTRLSLTKWFQIIFIMSQSKMGVSAKEVSRLVGVKYQTAWYACHRVRCAMIDNELRLEGMVEFDEAYIGGKKRKLKKSDANKAVLSTITNKRGRGTSKVPIVGSVEKKGRVYVKIIEKLTGRNLLLMLKKIVKTDESIVFTDEFKSYKSFDNVVEHITINHSEGYGKGVRTVNTIEGFWSILKNGIKGNYRSLSKKYLPFYLVEFSFKYNNRFLESDPFTTILSNAVKEDKCFIYYKPKCDTKHIVYGSGRCKQ
ncbi:MAG TPA: IS1595 family transposase [Bacteroidales bacterium]|nr:IS1595 family transposase [Bacteroidales bacterium]HBZ67270.1 IS1595 family transposase [Bacteroidales bacterium]